MGTCRKTRITVSGCSRARPNDMSTSAKHGVRGGVSGSLPLVDRFLYEVSRYSSTLLLLMVFSVETGVVIFVIRDMRAADNEVQRMYVGSVLGLRSIGGLQYDAQETRRSTLYALTTNDSNLQVEYADQSRAADRRVTEGISDYLARARAPREIDLGRRLQADWYAYLKVRDEVLASILEGSNQEAVDYDLAGGVPSFDRVRQDLEEIKRLYDEQASQRLAIVDASSRRSTGRLVGVLCFTLLFASVSIWVIQRSKMLSALKLAKLQMDFVASVSHELRTPLAVISASAQNIADGVVEEKEQLAKYGAVIRNHTRQLTELVNQILLFASTREGRIHYILRPLTMEQIFESVLRNTREVVQEAGFTVESSIEAGLPGIMGDSSALSQCLQNLLGNAVKYGGSHRRIHLRALLYKSDDPRAEEIRISVEDRGIGIDSSDLPHIFEPFYRSPAVAAAQIHGTGLGLPLAKSIAEAMGGKITVVSKIGVGSVFTLHLPVLKKGTRQTAAVGPDLLTRQ
jgi:signal transduction histidine kinase